MGAASVRNRTAPCIGAAALVALASLECSRNAEPEPEAEPAREREPCPEDLPDDGGAWSLDNACARLPRLLCDHRATCCEGAERFNRARCECELQRRCKENVELARQGRVRFHPERLDVQLERLDDLCMEALEHSASYYGASWYWRIWMDWIVDSYLSIFEGDVPLGGECETILECRQSVGGRAIAACRSGECVIIAPRQDGEKCGGGGGIGAEFCDHGLSCQVLEDGLEDDGDWPPPGTCQPRLPEGEPCRRGLALFGDPVCAPGLSCAGSSSREAGSAGVCEPRLALGEPCEFSSGYECAVPGRCVRGWCVETDVYRHLGSPCESVDQCSGTSARCLSGICVRVPDFCRYY